MPSVRWTAITGAALFAAIGCASTDAPDLDRREGEIAGGTKADTDATSKEYYRAVVRVTTNAERIDRKTRAKTAQSSKCPGVLVSDRVMITVKECVLGGRPNAGFDVKPKDWTVKEAVEKGGWSAKGVEACLYSGIGYNVGAIVLPEGKATDLPDALKKDNRLPRLLKGRLKMGGTDDEPVPISAITVGPTEVKGSPSDDNVYAKQMLIVPQHQALYVLGHSRFERFDAGSAVFVFDQARPRLAGLVNGFAITKITGPTTARNLTADEIAALLKKHGKGSLAEILPELRKDDKTYDLMDLAGRTDEDEVYKWIVKVITDKKCPVADKVELAAADPPPGPDATVVVSADAGSGDAGAPPDASFVSADASVEASPTPPPDAETAAPPPDAEPAPPPPDGGPAADGGPPVTFGELLRHTIDRWAGFLEPIFTYPTEDDVWAPEPSPGPTDPPAPDAGPAGCPCPAAAETIAWDACAASDVCELERSCLVVDGEGGWLELGCSAP